MHLTGACLCGAVAYEFDHQPGDIADICHCAQCRRASGAAALPWVQVPSSRFRVTSGTPKGFASSPQATRWFCGDCGTPLYMTDVEGRSVGITLGSLNQPEAIQPTVHGWVCEQVSWFSPPANLPRYERSPPYDL
jgi:hypothetical protein